MSVAGSSDGGDIAAHGIILASFETPDGQHHVDLCGALGDSHFGLADLGRGCGGSQRKANDGANINIGAGELLCHQGNERGIDADRRKAMLTRFPADCAYLLWCRLRFEQRVIDHLSQCFTFHGTSSNLG